MKTSKHKRIEEFERRNLEAAGLILDDPGRYPGLMQEWAMLVVERAKPTMRGPLFKQAAA